VTAPLTPAPPSTDARAGDARAARWRLDGKVALVTGAGQGVGLGIARALAEAGAAVAALDIDPARADDAAATLTAAGHRALAVVADVADPVAVEQAVAATVEGLGGLDVLVNNAHTVRSGALLDVTPDDLDTVWSTGFLGAFNGMKAAEPHLRGGGSVINVVSSVMLKQDTSGFLLYAATKTAMRSLTRTAAVEWGSRGIRVNALSPQTTSPAWVDWSAGNPEAAAKILSEVPLGHIGDAYADVGPVAVFLASDASAYMTGGLLLADGGRGHLR
jgi:NAD(P)-dependent dehydrogenase (short-subunit alcohol dehydrogenase family)